jgi:hypothetical protein
VRSRSKVSEARIDRLSAYLWRYRMSLYKNVYPALSWSLTTLVQYFVEHEELFTTINNNFIALYRRLFIFRDLLVGKAGKVFSASGVPRLTAQWSFLSEQDILEY